MLYLDSLFYLFVGHLTCTIVVFTTMCIANMVIHYDEVANEPGNENKDGGEIFFEVFSKYWAALIGAFIAVFVSLS